MCWYEDDLGAFACFYVVANFLRMGFFTDCVAIVVCSDFSTFLCGCKKNFRVFCVFLCSCLVFLGVFYVVTKPF